MAEPTVCMHGHPLVKLSAAVYACVPSQSSSLANVWEWNGTYLSSPPSYFAVLALCQRLVDESRSAAGSGGERVG